MGLLDRLRRTNTDLSSKTAASDARGTGTSEIGVSGESFLGGFEDTERRVDSLEVKDYVKMRQNDGTISSLYNILTLPILSTEWSIDQDEHDTNHEQADFIKNVLVEPPHKGGMEVPMSLVLADMLRAVIEGFRLFERVYRINDQGKIVLKKLASRDSQTVYLIRSAEGEYGGAHQRTTFKGEFIDVVLPAWKTFLFTYGKDKNYLYGESAFKPAAYHYTIKHKLYYLSNLAVQVGAIPPKIISGPEGLDNSVKTKLLREFDKLGIRTTAYKPANITVDAFDTSKGRLDPLPLIDHHNAEMARSVLAQFLMLGSAARSVGSWALSESHSDIFLMALKGVMAQIEDHINYYIIPDLIDLNFATPAYPEFHFADISPDTKQLMQETFVALATGGHLSEELLKGIEQEVSTSLGIDLDVIRKEIAKQKLKDAKEAAKNGMPDPNAPVAPVAPDPAAAPVGTPKPKPVPPTDPVVNSNDSKKKELSNTRWKRPLTPVEKRVSFAALEKKSNTLESDFVAAAKPIFTKMKDDAVLRLRKLLEAKDIKALSSFELKYTDEYRALVASTMREAYEFAKHGASDELKIPAPATSRSTTVLIAQNAQASADKLTSDLVFGIRAAIIAELRKMNLSTDLGLFDILATIGALFNLDQKIGLAGAVSVAMGVNYGRSSIFETAKDKIAEYQYSAILDATTCPTCEDLDKTIVDYAEYAATQWIPPIHFNCRCIWIAIKTDQDEIPETTGFPDSPGGMDEPDL